MSGTDRRRATVIVILGGLIALGPLTIDVYLPALPAIRSDLATTSAGVQLTITATMVGMAVGNLLVGPLSDMLGRRRPLLAGLVVHVVASLLCAVAADLVVLAAARVLQGVAVAAAGVIATAVLRDLFSGSVFARVLSRLLLIPMTAPILAPSLGGVVLRWTGWQGVFVVLAAASSALTVVVVLALPETLPADRRQPARPASTAAACRALVRDRGFVGFAVVTGLAMAALLAYVAGSSFVFQERYGLTGQAFGFVFGAGAVGLVVATQLNAWLLRRLPPQRILVAAMLVGATASLVLVASTVTGLGGLPGMLVPLWLTVATIGLVFPNTPALAMSRHGAVAGTAAALLGAVQFGVGGAAAPLVGLLGSGAPAMAAVVAVAMVAAAAVAIATTVDGRSSTVEGHTCTLKPPVPAVPVPPARRPTDLDHASEGSHGIGRPARRADSRSRSRSRSQSYRESV
jgi:DHA1 family bicyclomycin/chloramphenicol resistance-like MFS transporter